MSKSITLTAAVLAAAGLTAQASAQDITGGGTATYSPQSAHTAELADGTSVVTAHTHAVLVADDPDSPFHLSVQGCSGTTHVSAEGEPTSGAGYCTAGDADGDLWWLNWSNTADGSTWEVTHGTGKYAGMTGSGTSSELFSLPDGTSVIRWDGNWTMN